MGKNPIRFMAGNYVHRVDDACYVQLGDATVYFAGEKIIAFVASNVIYRTSELDNGIVYKRIRSAVMRHKASKVHQVTRDDLHTMVEAAIMTMASKLVDERLK
jgi:hypothetical protein